MLLYWYQEGIKGNNHNTPADDLKWNQLPALNERIYLKWKDASLETVLLEFEAAHQQIYSLTESLPEDLLFKPDLYPWMRNWPLARWMNSVTISHYRWGRTLIKKWRKSNAI
jgi:hypothetical protein